MDGNWGRQLQTRSAGSKGVGGARSPAAPHWLSGDCLIGWAVVGGDGWWCDEGNLLPAAVVK